MLGTLVRGNGALLRHKITDTVTPENVKDVWSKLTDMSQASRLNSIEVINLINNIQVFVLNSTNFKF